jgi:hypothetical protein
MKARLIIAAIFLLALFSLKMGTGLLLHNLFHTVSKPITGDHSEKAEKELTYACNCIDDFLTPFAETTNFYLDSPVLFSQVENDHVPGHPATLFFTNYLLRGPPAFNC